MLDINTKDYWNGRYKAGGNSGAGSYGRLAAYKAEILNGFIAEHGIRTMAELGCGDGNQLGLLKVERYTGYDISSQAVEMCKERYRGDGTRAFRLYDPLGASFKKAQAAELSVSLDVVYHLLEDRTYESYMRDLFRLSERFVIIYSSNTDDRPGMAAHLRCHRFTDWVEANLPDWTLCGYLPNRYPFRPDSPDDTSMADFHFFSRHERIGAKYACLLDSPGETAAPTDAEAAELMRLAGESVRAGGLEKAAGCLRSASANRGAMLLAINGLGAVLGAMGRHQEAEEAMKAVLAREPKNAQARINLAKLYLSRERWGDLPPFRGELLALRATDARVAMRWPLIAVKVGNPR
ncbi:MAG: tetratricopeptide repeat protein [Deltaproteobacteria bacterium]|jgi:tetratricopeptide (TPR) repeat protein|nr:tetratricopeptide repeat protein [Deltaproteobacteria bacterium]